MCAQYLLHCKVFFAALPPEKYSVVLFLDFARSRSLMGCHIVLPYDTNGVQYVRCLCPHSFGKRPGMAAKQKAYSMVLRIPSSCTAFVCVCVFWGGDGHKESALSLRGSCAAPVSGQDLTRNFRFLDVFSVEVCGPTHRPTSSGTISHGRYPIVHTQSLIVTGNCGTHQLRGATPPTTRP